MKILGIETSCDETAAAVVEDGTTILSSVVASQAAVHHPYGGVVPELASRKHIESILPVVNQSLSDAGLNPKDLDGVAVTRGPGLVGALLVGFCFAKSFAYALNIPWVGVDHLKGHLNSVFLEPPTPPFPFVALLASGGHTAIYHVVSHLQAECMGQTLDDAAGEAFDKVAKMLGLGYPGGRVVSEFAEKGNPNAVKFLKAYHDKNSFNFSFSGIKTAVSRYIQSHQERYQDQIADIAAAFQKSVVDVLTYQIIRAAKEKQCFHIALVGGVAANRNLRMRVGEEAVRNNFRLYLPSMALCGDNAAMIAALGYQCLKSANGPIGDISDDVYSRGNRSI
ncbi:MAG: tRNA (adenosine(37)-N6)-threonylcarbamoyltransferase complex transferase subunit TsaD [Desulfobacterales bacterium]|jgi:N6-L-threonylcarbamoyladenine synthase|nr:tRNA (adenosine(37)-N6)-threonylcarbamoyltransferase complex transferase subunit TsaD [Desulfobacterales bacterium]